VRIDGLADLERRLEAVANNVGRDKAVRSALMAAATPIAKAAIAKAPERTGQLRKSIKKRSRVNKSTGRVAVFVGVNRKGFFGMHIEFGTKTAPARPFLRPAFDENAQEAVLRFKRFLAKKVERMERGSGR